MPNIKIPSLDGASLEAYAAYPEKEHGPGLIVIRGLFSTPERIEKICNDYAARGYVAVSPNLFQRQGEYLENHPGNEPDWEKTSKLYKNFDVEAGIRDLLATLAFIRAKPSCGGKVGSLGFCLGSRLAYLMSSRSDIDCSVGYYGVGIENMLDEVYDIRTPLLLHFGENDKLLQPSARQKITRALDKNSVISYYIYPGCDHGFARETSATYNPAQAAIAHERTIAFFHSHLKD